MPGIPGLRRLRQEDCEFEVSLDSIVRLCLKKKKQILKKKILRKESYTKEENLRPKS
jgi:hypothetical protein